MKDNEYQKQILDKLSPSFCGAKWFNATIWLGSGMTTSCHHPPAHKIDINEIKNNPSALHNTKEKKEHRRQMQCGERPKGCEYCWKIEDMNNGSVSDRTYKSKIYPENILSEAKSSSTDTDWNLKTLEIAFDRTCNFACSYCNPAFSTTWVRDIKTNGPYTDLKSDGRNHFTHPHNAAQLYKLEETNPYVEAFFTWWQTDLHRSLDELRITGGEPMMSPHFWRLLDWFADEKNRVNPSMRFAVNTNLVPKPDLFEKFLDRCGRIPNLHIYTSNEAMFDQADYIRDGMKYSEWFSNFVNLMVRLQPKGFHVMCTVNALCLESLPEFLSRIVQFKKSYRQAFGSNVNFTLNILRFPSFQSPLVLPTELKMKFRQNLIEWLSDNDNDIEPMEKEHVKRLIEYLQEVTSPHAGAAEIDKLQKDFKNFYKQYDKRRGKDLVKTFPIIGEWYSGI